MQAVAALLVAIFFMVLWTAAAICLLPFAVMGALVRGACAALNWVRRTA
ncbi:hypothetical protein [Cupriavidus gilardii]|uniref:Uncharacterized protein n=1 Tax=Cupriavidus gilardii TaxID=82541 RepID=A0ABY4VQN7_9BURK|nr:hypothetical protein [Cupriavidus gilardii]MCT9125391.1 hypothetical protein [Cupriavidus gilardii]USE79504.1 hypothetical protein NDR89_23215 [Cupriavidus gilardii]